MLRFNLPSSGRTFTLCVCLIIASTQLAACSSRQQKAKNYYDQGQSYLAKKEYAKARIEFRNAIQQNREMIEAWRALAQIDEHSRNFRELAGSLSRIVDLDKRDVDSRVKLGKLYLLGGALDKALNVANEATDLAPTNPSVLALKAAILFRLKDSDTATSVVEKSS